jgi:ribonucleotide reductase beta subunit family protein with ferritin-like domain
MASTTAQSADSAATQSNGAGASSAQIGSLPADAISYEDLYMRWEHGHWSAMDLDFSEDAKQWQERFTEFERQAALWNYALFFWGEDAVAEHLSPYIDAAPLEEQKYFLTTQQVDEARHAVFFKRFMKEVCGIGDGSPASALNAIKPQLSPGFVKVFERLDSMAAELRKDRSRPKLAAAVTLYHLVIEATLAQPGQHMICSYLEKRDALPAFRAGMENISADEQRHIGFGVKLISDLAREDPAVPAAVAGLLREVMPFLAQVMMPPGWDERYLTCFGYDFERISVEATTSLRTKLRSAGLPMDELPGPPLVPQGLSIEEMSRRGRELARAGVIGVRLGPSRRDPETLELLFDTISRQVNPRHGLRRPTILQWEFTDADVPTWHLIVDNGTSRVEQGDAPDADLRMQVAYQDFVDIIGNRLNPLKAIATGKLRPRGNPLVLGKMGKIFPRG